MGRLAMGQWGGGVWDCGLGRFRCNVVRRGLKFYTAAPSEELVEPLDTAESTWRHDIKVLLQGSTGSRITESHAECLPPAEIRIWKKKKTTQGLTLTPREQNYAQTFRGKATTSDPDCNPCRRFGEGHRRKHRGSLWLQASRIGALIESSFAVCICIYIYIYTYIFIYSYIYIYIYILFCSSQKEP